mmetsp:Transcript_42060/g.122018  ORF Transcript_42060/g.122018 Transcript_42060/m.122018 type:complete len:248 (-) Transcript_42060:1051-1794(-)
MTGSCSAAPRSADGKFSRSRMCRCRCSASKVRTRWRPTGLPHAGKRPHTGAPKSRKGRLLQEPPGGAPPMWRKTRPTTTGMAAPIPTPAAGASLAMTLPFQVSGASVARTRRAAAVTMAPLPRTIASAKKRRPPDERRPSAPPRWRSSRTARLRRPIGEWGAAPRSAPRRTAPLSARSSCDGRHGARRRSSPRRRCPSRLRRPWCLGARRRPRRRGNPLGHSLGGALWWRSRRTGLGAAPRGRRWAP